MIIDLTKLFTCKEQASIVWETMQGDKLCNDEALSLIRSEWGMGEIGDIQAVFSDKGVVRALKRRGVAHIIMVK